MGTRMQRLEVLRVILSCNEMGSHEEILKELAKNRLGCDAGHPFARFDKATCSQNIG